MTTRYTCECGANIATSSRKRHENSRKHKDNIPTDIKFPLSDLPKDLFNLVFSFCNEKTLKQCIFKYPVVCFVRKHQEYSVHKAMVYFVRFNEMQIMQYLCVKIKKQIDALDRQERYEERTIAIRKIYDAIKTAARYGHLDMIKYLYSVVYLIQREGYNPDYPSRQLDRALDIAYTREDINMVQYLQSIGAKFQ